MKKWKKRTFIMLSILCIAIASCCWFILPNLILCPYRFRVEEHVAELSAIHPSEYGLIAEDYDIRTADSLQIQAWKIHSRQGKARGTIIMIHGTGSCKESFLSLAATMAEEGFQTVLFDLRAQGASDGQHCTYGFEEKKDIRLFTNKLLSEDPTIPVGVFGSSLGGAIAYQCLADDPRLTFGIIESTYDEIKNVVRAYTSRFLGFRCNVLADFALWRAEEKGGFESTQINPVDAARKIQIPLFVSHGSDDIHIPISFGKRNFESLSNKNSIFYEVPGADHNHVHHAGGPAYHKSMLDYLKVQCPPTQTFEN